MALIPENIWEQYDAGVISEHDAYLAIGAYYNYPKCCCETFADLITQNIPPAKFFEAFWGRDVFTKYVRCKECREKN